jgi:hypothetical protein
MRKTMFPVCLTMMLLASCATTGPGKTEFVTVDSACEWVKPIYIADADKLTPETARQLLSHNRAWKAACADRKP